MKDLEFLGDSLKVVTEFPKDARQVAGYQLRRVQQGKVPEDFKPIPTIGRGVNEIRIWGEDGTYRVIYMARLESRVYVLHSEKDASNIGSGYSDRKLRFSQLVRGLS